MFLILRVSKRGRCTREFVTVHSCDFPPSTKNTACHAEMSHTFSSPWWGHLDPSVSKRTHMHDIWTLNPVCWGVFTVRTKSERTSVRVQDWSRIWFKKKFGDWSIFAEMTSSLRLELEWQPQRRWPQSKPHESWRHVRQFIQISLVSRKFLSNKIGRAIAEKFWPKIRL